MGINVNITSMKDFDQAIERIGKLQDEIKSRKDEIDKLTEIVSAYAKENKILEGVAGDYEYELIGAPRALKFLPGIKQEMAIELLKKQAVTRGYIYEAPDKDALKKAFGRNQATRKEIEKYGFMFTEPERNKIKVVAR